MMDVYAYRDESLQLHNPPFVSTTEKQAIMITRNLLLADRAGSIRALADKLVLVRLGTFDEVTGKLTGSDPVEVIRLSSIYVPEGGIEDDQNV